jgi:hypothetical protein
MSRRWRYSPSHDRLAWHEAILTEILDERVPPRRHRRNKRGVKRKMSNFPVRRESDQAQDPIDILKTIRIIK